MTYEANIILIKESLHTIVRQLDSPKARISNDIKASASKIYNLVIQKDSPAERFYFIYLTCKLCIGAKQNKIDKLVKILLPSPPTTQSMALISDLISFAVCHSSIYSDILDNMSSYLNISDLVNVDVEHWQQAESLALHSPNFCSALLSRSDLPLLGIDKKLLANWLQDLSRVEQDFPPPSLNQLIRYLLSHDEDRNVSQAEAQQSELANSDFHFGILVLIQSRRCQTLTNHFLIDMVNNLASLMSKSTRITANNLVDKFAQILSVAAANKVTTITNALKTTLAKLDSNQLIVSIIQWQQK